MFKAIRNLFSKKKKKNNDLVNEFITYVDKSYLSDSVEVKKNHTFLLNRFLSVMKVVLYVLTLISIFAFVVVMMSLKIMSPDDMFGTEANSLIFGISLGITLCLCLITFIIMFYKSHLKSASHIMYITTSYGFSYRVKYDDLLSFSYAKRKDKTYFFTIITYKKTLLEIDYCTNGDDILKNFDRYYSKYYIRRNLSIFLSSKSKHQLHYDFISAISKADLEDNSIKTLPSSEKVLLNYYEADNTSTNFESAPVSNDYLESNTINVKSNDAESSIKISFDKDDIVTPKLNIIDVDTKAVLNDEPYKIDKLNLTLRTSSNASLEVSYDKRENYKTDAEILEKENMYRTKNINKLKVISTKEIHKMIQNKQYGQASVGIIQKVEFLKNTTFNGTVQEYLDFLLRAGKITENEYQCINITRQIRNKYIHCAINIINAYKINSIKIALEAISKLYLESRFDFIRQLR